ATSEDRGAVERKHHDEHDHQQADDRGRDGVARLRHQLPPGNRFDSSGRSGAESCGAPSSPPGSGRSGTGSSGTPPSPPGSGSSGSGIPTSSSVFPLSPPSGSEPQRSTPLRNTGISNAGM